MATKNIWWKESFRSWLWKQNGTTVAVAAVILEVIKTEEAC